MTIRPSLLRGAAGVAGGPDGVGLTDQEPRAVTDDSADIGDEGSWTADADLTLTTPIAVNAGDCSSALTLSLLE